MKQVEKAVVFVLKEGMETRVSFTFFEQVYSERSNDVKRER